MFLRISDRIVIKMMEPADCFLTFKLSFFISGVRDRFHVHYIIADIRSGLDPGLVLLHKPVIEAVPQLP